MVCSTRILGLCGLVGCGASTSSQAPTWIGLDTRPLAVGSQIPVEIDLSTDGGELDYALSSSDPSVVQLSGDGGLQLMVEVLDAGTATLRFESNFGSTTWPVTAAVPESVTFAVASRLVFESDTALPAAGFDLVYGGSELIQALVYDGASSPNELNSWGLVTASQNAGALLVDKIEPESFRITATHGAATSDTFGAGLVGQSATSYAVGFITPPPSGSLVYSGGEVLAEAATSSMTEVLGLGDWVFACQPSSSCTVDQLSLSVAKLSIPANSPPGSFTVTATATPGAGQMVTAEQMLP